MNRIKEEEEDKRKNVSSSQSTNNLSGNESNPYPILIEEDNNLVNNNSNTTLNDESNPSPKPLNDVIVIEDSDNSHSNSYGSTNKNQETLLSNSGNKANVNNNISSISQNNYQLSNNIN